MNDEPQHKHRKYYILALFAVFIAILGVILPEFEPTPITYLNASDINVTGATAVGSLINITEINNGYYNVSEINAQPYYVIVNFTNITNFSFVEVKAKYFSSSGTPSTHIVDLEILCHTDMEYEDVFFLENAAEWRYFTRHFPDSSHFINGDGNVSIKFNHSSNGNVNHRLWIDTVRLILLPQYAQNTVTLNQFFNTTNGTGSQNLSQVLANGNEGNNQNVNNISNLNMTGKLMINTTTAYTGLGYTLLNMGRTSSEVKFRATLNDANGAYNFRVNVKDDITQDNTSWSGWSFAMQPGGHRFGITTVYPGTTNAYNPFAIYSHASPTYPNGRILIGDSGTATTQYEVQIKNLSIAGTGNFSLVIADSTGKLIAIPMNGTGNHYGCFNVSGYPYPGTPGC